MPRTPDRRRLRVAAASPRRLMIVTAAVAMAGTLLVVAVPDVHFAYRAPSLHVALETTAALVALLAGYVVLGRFWSSGRVDHLLLVGALGLIACTDLFFAAIPPAVAGDHNGPFATWATATGHLLGAAVLAAAALARERQLRSPRRAALLGAAGLLLTIGAVAAVTLLAADLPPGITAPPDQSGTPDLVGPPTLLAIELATMLAFIAATVGLTRRAAGGDALMRWFAVGATLAGAAWLNYFLYPSEFTEFIYTGDILRLCAYLVLLGGAVHEIRHYWSGLVDAAILDERRRIARDLHDGMAQELALIGRKARRLADGDHAAEADEIAAAADRALVDARRAIAALSDVVDRPLAHVLAADAEDVAARHGISLELDVEQVPTVGREEQATLLKISGEAISNAARHARASRVRLRLGDEGGVRLVIADDGIGFDPERVTAAAGRFGLQGMAERARAVGAEFRITSVPGAGTRVEVMLP